MKKFLIFIAGIITGIVLFIGISFFVASSSSNNGITLFEEEGEYESVNSFRIFQVIESGNALATELEGEFNLPTNFVVLFLNNEGQSYYDDQIINVPAGKHVKQIGIYKYFTKDKIEKTVPVVVIRDK